MARDLVTTSAVLLLGLALLTAACGGSSSPTSPPVVPPPSTPSIRFTAGGAAGSNSISLAAPAGQRLLLDVVATDVADLYGVSFDLTFPTGQLRYNGVTEGGFLAQGGSATSLQIVESPAGRLIVGISRLGSLPGASGSGVLATLEFVSAATGSGAFRFSDNTAFDSAGAAQGGVTWIAGTVEVTL